MIVHILLQKYDFCLYIKADNYLYIPNILASKYIVQIIKKGTYSKTGTLFVEKRAITNEELCHILNLIASSVNCWDC